MLYVVPQDQPITRIVSVVTRANKSDDVRSEKHLSDSNAALEVYIVSNVSKHMSDWLINLYIVRSFE